MKKYLSLTILVFCIAIITLGSYTISANMPLVDQDLNSETKEISEIDTTKILSDTQETDLANNSLATEDSKDQKVIENLDSNLDNLVQEDSPITEEQKNENTEKNSEITKPLEENTEEISTPTDQEIPSQASSNSTSSKKSNAKLEPKYSFLNISSNVSAENLKIAENELAQLPDEFIDTFDYENWTISISDENISSKYFNGLYSNVMGVTITDAKQIIIQNKKSSIQNSIVHEFGHYLDWYFDFPSLSDEFSDIYNEEVSTFKSRIKNASCVRNPMEFFAHTFYYFIKDSSKCTPEALQFVKSYVDRVSL